MEMRFGITEGMWKERNSRCKGEERENCEGVWGKEIKNVEGFGREEKRQWRMTWRWRHWRNVKR